MRKSWKKLIAVALSTVMAFSLVGCDLEDETGSRKSGLYATADKAADPDSEEIGELMRGIHPINQDYDTTSVKSEIDKKHKGTWAIYWYLCGSDLESQAGAGTTDLAEMLDATMPEGVTVVIETGGSSAWMTDEISENKLTRFVYDESGLNEVGTVKNADMGKKKTLKNFLKFCKKNYPADNQAVLFWDHGGGSLGGACYDENFGGNHLTINEIGSTLKSLFSKKKLELVGFDCCLMASVDTAKLMSESAKTMVASEETEPGCGWYYTDWLNALGANPTMSNKELGKAICDSYMKGCKAIQQDEETTLSVLDLGQMPNMINALNLLGCELLSQAGENVKTISRWGRAAAKAENYGGNNDSTGYFDMIDIGDFIAHGKDIIPNSYDALSTALQEMVAYSVHGSLRKKSTGLSMYYPLDGSEASQQKFEALASSDIYASYTRMSITGKISKKSLKIVNHFIKSCDKANGSEEEAKATAVPEIDTSQENAEVNQEKLTFTNGGKDLKMGVTNEGYLYTNIGEQNIDAVKAVYADLLYYSAEDDLYLDLGRDDDVDINWDTGVIQDNFTGYWPCIDGVPIYLDIVYQGEDYNLYSVPIKYNGKEMVMNVSFDLNSEAYKIVSIENDVSENKSNQRASKVSILPKAGDKITPILYYYDEDADDFVAFEVDTITYQNNTKIKAEDLGDGDYALQFETEDMAGNSVYSEYGYIKYEDGEVEADIEPIQ